MVDLELVRKCMVFMVIVVEVLLVLENTLSMILEALENPMVHFRRLFYSRSLENQHKDL